MAGETRPGLRDNTGNYINKSVSPLRVEKVIVFFPIMDDLSKARWLSGRGSWRICRDSISMS